METRDQWYKPNLLYNIHYRPPKNTDAHRMIVETVRFNPSFCTCGGHDCAPRYRMERRVIWSDGVMVSSTEKKPKEDSHNFIIKEGNTEAKSTDNLEKGNQSNGSAQDSNDNTIYKKVEKGYAINENSEESGENGKNNSDSPTDVISGIYDYTCNCNRRISDRNSKTGDGMIGEKCDGKLLDGFATDRKDVPNENGRREDTNYDDRREGDSDIDVRRNRKDVGEGESSENGKYGDVNMDEDDKDRSRGINVYRVDEKDNCATTEREISKTETAEFSCALEDRSSDNEYISSSRVSGEDDPGTAYDDEYAYEDTEISASFGIMSVYCNSELHSWYGSKIKI